MAINWKFWQRKPKVIAKEAVPAEPVQEKTPAKPAKTAAKKPAAKKPAAKAASAQCAAMTAAGKKCSSQSRDGSKYCGRHKNYRATTKAAAKPAKTAAKKPAAKKTAAKKPAAKKTAAKKPAAKKTAAKKTANSTKHVSHGDYKLYQKGNRFFYSKKTQAEAKKDGAQAVYKMPAGREVVVTPNGLPVLKKA